MGKVTLIIKRCFYYILGFISFSTIAFITQRIVEAMLLEVVINPMQDFSNILNYILAYYPFYFVVYTLLHFTILYSVKKYDKHIMNKLNTKLEKVKECKKMNNRGDSNV